MLREINGEWVNVSFKQAMKNVDVQLEEATLKNGIGAGDEATWLINRKKVRWTEGGIEKSALVGEAQSYGVSTAGLGRISSGDFPVGRLGLRDTADSK